MATVYRVFRKWTLDNTLEAINACLRAMVRKSVGKRSRPTAAVLDSQSVISDPHGGWIGYDATKRIKGRKRHIVVDTLGLLLGIEITAADVPERDGAQTLLGDVLSWYSWLRLLWVDGPNFAQWVNTIRPNSPLRWSSEAMISKASTFCLVVGSWSEPSVGSCAIAASFVITKRLNPAPPPGLTSL